MSENSLKIGLDILEKIDADGGNTTPEQLSISFQIQPDEALEILKYGSHLGIFFDVFNPANPMKTEFQLKDIILEKVHAGVDCSELDEFSDFVKKYYGEVKDSTIYLDVELTDLREEVLMALSLKHRQKATELIVGEFEKRENIFTTRDDLKSEMWIYKNGIYLPQGKSFVKEFCRKILGKAITLQFINEVILKIEIDTFIEADQFFSNNNPFEVPIIDGILHILERKIYPFSPKKIFFNKLPIKYNPSAKCPKITEHFKTILRDESDVNVMFELFGYTLLKENKLETAFMFVGDGRNGKTKTLELMKRFLGVENCSGLPLTALTDDSFTLCEIFGKMVNLAGDLSYHELKEAGTIKMLIGRDLIHARRKFLHGLKFVNYAKLIFACNELPRIYDMTDGFWTKWILLEFPFKFVSSEEMKDLSSEEKQNCKLINTNIIMEISTPEEMSGLLNEALEGLKRILKAEKFSYSKGTQEVKEMWIRKSDSFMAFCLDFVKEDFESRTSKQELRRQYNIYCRAHKLRGSSDKAIKITLENMFGATDMQGSDFDRYWNGIKLKQQIKSEDTEQIIVQKIK